MFGFGGVAIQELCMDYLAKFGTPEQKARYLPAMTAGQCIGSLAMTEPGAGR